MKKTLTLILITLFSYSFVFSQNNSTKKADRLYDRLEFVKAAEEYLKLSDSELNSEYVITRLANCYYNLFETREAEKWFKKIVNKNPDAELIYKYSQMLKANGKYKESNLWMNKFSEMKPYDSRAVSFKNTPNYIDKIINKGKRFNIQNLKIAGKIPAAPTTKGPNGEKVELDIDIELTQTEFGKTVSILIPPIPGDPKAYFFDKQIGQYVWDDAFRWDTSPENTLDSTVDYFAEIKMFDGGVILVDLFEKLAPATVNNFVFLSESGFYDRVTFHRVIPGFVAQGGDPTGSGMAGPGYKFDNELNINARHDTEGIISMANAGIQNGKGSNGSQFFITYAPLPQLDGFDENGLEKDCAEPGQSCHPVFGRVIEGMDVVRKIAPVDPSQNGPPGDAIDTISIVRK